jgi:hypothetical protein
MNFKKWVNYVKESVKEDVLDRILDKIHNKQKLTDIEKKFLDRYNETSDEEYQDFRFLTKNDASLKIKEIIDGGRKIICDLYDRDGKIGIEITKIKNDFEHETSEIHLKNKEVIKLKDNYLYNIIYNSTKDEYSLESQDEYYEKIPVHDEN